MYYLWLGLGFHGSFKLRHYVTLDNGKRIMMRCDDRDDALEEFRKMDLQGHHAVLTSRPNAGIMDVK